MTRRIYARYEDAVRIVPLYLPEGQTEPTAEARTSPPPAPPHLTYRNGPLLTAVEVFTVFWGSAWQQPTQRTITNNLNGFFDFILTSALMDQLAEYSIPGQTIGHGKRIGSIAITAPEPGHSVSDTAIRHMLQQEISTNAGVPEASPNTLYFVYLPPGVRVVQGGAASCQAFCGYHDSIAGQVFYAVMPYAGCTGCLGGLSAFDALTSTSSHELCESITDAVPGGGWYDDTHGEIGDICAWKTKKVGAYTVQLEWSNRMKHCL